MQLLTFSNCQLDPSLGSGKTRLRWTEGLRNLGHEVSVVEPHDFRKRPFRKADQLKFSLDAIPGGLQTHWRDVDIVEVFGGEFGLLTASLYKLRKHGRPKIIAHADGLELLARERAKVYDPATHSKLHHRFASSVYGSIDMLSFKHTDGFVCGSDEDLRYFRSIKSLSKIPSRSIAPGVDPEFLNRPFQPNGKHRVAYLGTWTTRKAPDRIVRVMTQVFQIDAKTTFHVFGSPSQKEEILKAFAPCFRERVVVYPKLSAEDLAGQLSQCSLLFFPSHNEGFGMALTEAMACSLPIVTTPTGFGSDLQDGVDGLVCDFEDEAKMRDSILLLLADKEERTRIAKNGWNRIQSLNWETQIKSLESTYLEWLS
tara:strand:+ start:309 stop:1415 length:1107 start_codon:yes stop_codon:yes gene_type:complete